MAVNFRPSVSSKFVTVPTYSYCLLASLLASLRGLASLSTQVCDPQVYYESCNTGWGRVEMRLRLVHGRLPMYFSAADGNDLPC